MGVEYAKCFSMEKAHDPIPTSMPGLSPFCFFFKVRGDRGEWKVKILWVKVFSHIFPYLLVRVAIELF